MESCVYIQEISYDSLVDTILKGKEITQNNIKINHDIMAIEL